MCFSFRLMHSLSIWLLYPGYPGNPSLGRPPPRDPLPVAHQGLRRHCRGQIRNLGWAVDAALRADNRSLPGGSSLTQMLAGHRAVRNIQRLSPLTVEQILAWAEEHHHRTGAWPTAISGSVVATAREDWRRNNMGLRAGARGLPGRSSLPKQLAEHRGTRNRTAPSATSSMRSPTCG